MVSKPKNVSIVKNAYACFFKGDLQGFLANFTEESVLEEAESLPYGGTFRGPAAAAEALAQISKVWRDINFDILDITSGERFVIAYGIFSAVSRATGKNARFPIAEVWEVENDRVVRVAPHYFDTAIALQALS